MIVEGKNYVVLTDKFWFVGKATSCPSPGDETVTLADASLVWHTGGSFEEFVANGFDSRMDVAYVGEVTCLNVRAAINWNHELFKMSK